MEKRETDERESSTRTFAIFLLAPFHLHQWTLVVYIQIATYEAHEALSFPHTRQCNRIKTPLDVVFIVRLHYVSVAGFAGAVACAEIKVHKTLVYHLLDLLALIINWFMCKSLLSYSEDKANATNEKKRSSQHCLYHGASERKKSIALRKIYHANATVMLYFLTLVVCDCLDITAFFSL